MMLDGSFTHDHHCPENLTSLKVLSEKGDEITITCSCTSHLSGSDYLKLDYCAQVDLVHCMYSRTSLNDTRRERRNVYHLSRLSLMKCIIYKNEKIELYHLLNITIIRLKKISL